MINFSNLARVFFPSLIWRVKTNEQKIYLTFDDGPTPEVTSWVLEQLKKYNAKASFFCVGENVQKYPEIYSLIKKAGHRIGNHTFNHLNGWKTPNEVYYKNIQKASEVIESNFFRPPYGKIKWSQIKFLKPNYKLVMWDVLSYDFDKTKSPEYCASVVINQAGKGSIIVFHDSLKARKNLEIALPKTLEYFSKLNYSFEVLPSA